MANRGSYPNIATRIANQQAMVDAGLAANDTCTVDGTSLTWDGTGWQSPYPPLEYQTTTPEGASVFPGGVITPNSISSFLPGQTAGVPDTASLTVAAGVSQRVALPTGTVFRLDWSGYGPFAFRFGSSSVVAVATDFPGSVGLPQYFDSPAGATHIAVYGIGGGTLVVSGGSQP